MTVTYLVVLKTQTHERCNRSCISCRIYAKRNTTL